VRVAVVGVGGVGSAAARFLAAAGHSVVAFERFRLGHTRGSSHGESRIIRYAYPDALYTRLAAAAYPLWSALEAEAGEELLVPCGGLTFGPAAHPDLAATERALAGAGRAFETLAPEAVRERFPALRLRAGEAAVYQADGGFLRATRCVLANARLARRHGAVIEEEVVVREVVARGREVVVRAEPGGERAFDRAVVTAGPWVGALLARLGLPLSVTRQRVAYLRVAGAGGVGPLAGTASAARPPAAAERFRPERFPVWIDVASLYYGVPSDGRIEGVKVGAHRLGEVVDPDVPPRPLAAGDVADIVAYAVERFDGLTGDVVRAEPCLYTNAPNEDFILDRPPDAPNVWLVSGCSGHGFKFTVLLGKVAAELAAGAEGGDAPAGVAGVTSRDLERFALARFR
jgi:monomeric sarcosine oxidase